MPLLHDTDAAETTISDMVLSRSTPTSTSSRCYTTQVFLSDTLDRSNRANSCKDYYIRLVLVIIVMFSTSAAVASYAADWWGHERTKAFNPNTLIRCNY